MTSDKFSWKVISRSDGDLTYRDLFESLSPEMMDQSISVYVADTDEFHPLRKIKILGPEQDVLDPGAIVLVI